MLILLVLALLAITLLLVELASRPTLLHLLVLHLIESRVIPLIFGVGLACGLRGSPSIIVALWISSFPTTSLVMIVPLTVLSPTSIVSTALATPSGLILRRLRAAVGLGLGGTTSGVVARLLLVLLLVGFHVIV